MCNLSSEIYDKGSAEGITEGIAKGKAEGIVEGKAEGSILNAVKVVNNLLAKNFTLEEALPIANIDRDTYEKYVDKEN
jgi:predicted transposase YdaD